MDPIQAPPNIFTNPDYYESMAVVLTAVVGMITAGVKYWIINPHNENFEEIVKSTSESLNKIEQNTSESMNKIDSDVSKISDKLEDIRVSIATVKNSVESAHHRIDEVTERVNRMENLFIKDKLK